MFDYSVSLDGERLVIEVNDSYGASRRYRRMSYLYLDSNTAKKYLESLTDHIRYVREAGEKIGVPQEQLIIHDDSKWEKEEFPHYARKFHGTRSPIDNNQVINNFTYAWLHHMHQNPHHWQHWIFSDGYAPKESDAENGGILYMPDYFALEMIADWMGASKAYTDSWDMGNWLRENMHKIKLHSKTAGYVREQLDLLGYGDIVFSQKFGHEEG